jgi:hypothetical protein
MQNMIHEYIQIGIVVGDIFGWRHGKDRPLIGRYRGWINVGRRYVGTVDRDGLRQRVLLITVEQVPFHWGRVFVINVVVIIVDVLIVDSDRAGRHGQWRYMVKTSGFVGSAKEQFPDRRRNGGCGQNQQNRVAAGRAGRQDAIAYGLDRIVRRFVGRMVEHRLDHSFSRRG